VNNKDAITFLNAAASYFENRPTGGEDQAHWSNVYNAENCRKIAAMLEKGNDVAEVLSGCAVRAAIQQEGQNNDAHYLGAIKVRLLALYDLTEAPNVREQISDELDWVNEKLGVKEG
jgi:hypothetical protein